MPLVHVVFADAETERIENAGAAEAEDDFLLQAVDLVAAVQFVGDTAILILVAGDIGIEKKHRHLSAGRAFDPVQPGLQLDIATFDGDQRFHRQQFHEGLRLPVAGEFLLPAIGTDLLQKISLAADQGDGYHRHFQVGGGFDRIPRQHPQAAAVGGDVIGQARFPWKNRRSSVPE